MKGTPSVLVGMLSGKAGGTVAANWKGRMYFRTLVTPANPKSDDQKTQRGYMARQGKWFRSLDPVLVHFLDEYGTGVRISGFNVMAKENLRAMHKSLDPYLKPGNPHEPQVEEFEAVQGVGEVAQIDITWAAGIATGTDYMHIWTCPVDPDEAEKEVADVWSHDDGEAVTVLTETTTVTASLADKAYYVVGIILDTATLAAAAHASGGVAHHATSKES